MGIDVNYYKLIKNSHFEYVSEDSGIYYPRARMLYHIFDICAAIGIEALKLEELWRDEESLGTYGCDISEARLDELIVLSMYLPEEVSNWCSSNLTNFLNIKYTDVIDKLRNPETGIIYYENYYDFDKEDLQDVKDYLEMLLVQMKNGFVFFTTG